MGLGKVTFLIWRITFSYLEMSLLIFAVCYYIEITNQKPTEIILFKYDKYDKR